MSQDFLATILGFGILIYSVILHEIAHGLMAEQLGDPTARRAGRLTLNPIPHIDPLLTIALPAIMYFGSRHFGTGGIIFGAAKPVPINPLYFEDPKRDTALVSLAGVITNFILAAAAALSFHLGGNTIPFLAQVLQFTVYINLLLGVFNLIPIPPLDGSKVLLTFLPRHQALILQSLEPMGFVLILLLFMTGLGSIIGQIIASLMSFLNMPLF